MPACPSITSRRASPTRCCGRWIGKGADPAVGRSFRRLPADPADFFHRWLAKGTVPGDTDGGQSTPYFRFERGWWEQRHRANVLLVHHADLKADLPGEMRRVVDCLGIAVPDEAWPALVEAAGFEAMRRAGAVMMPPAAVTLRDGSDQFFHRGGLGRWRTCSGRRNSPFTGLSRRQCSRPAAVGDWRLRGGDPGQRPD